jgi:nucleotide-binding universal stress UspA family protein
MDTAVIEGISHSSIVRFADECKADLLVLNLQSKRFLERVMLGATAERVIRSSHIPVLSIPIKAGESAA